jgi:predicted hotdog family 3-hydroxylacyl-ACP dehydratase
LTADEAEAVFVDAARAVPRREEVQLVDHVVVATDEGPIARAQVEPELRLVRAGRLRLVPVVELEKWLDSNAARVFEDVA